MNQILSKEWIHVFGGVVSLPWDVTTSFDLMHVVDPSKIEI